MNDLIDKEQFFKLKNEQLPWIEKHRPINIDDIIFTDEMKLTINTMVKNKEIPCLLLTGSPGTGA